MLLVDELIVEGVIAPKEKGSHLTLAGNRGSKLPLMSPGRAVPPD